MEIKNVVKLTDGFGVDDAGKVWALPMKLPGNSPSIVQKGSSTKKTTVRRRPYIHVEPLSATLEYDEQPRKKRKVQKSARKELFKVPKNTERLSYQRQSSVGKKFNFTKTQPANIPESTADSSLNAKPKKPFSTTARTVLFPITEKNNEDTSTINNEDSVNSELEFLQLERTLASATKLPKRKVSSTQKENMFHTVISLVQEEMEEFNVWRQQTLEFEKRHDSRILNIIQLLTQDRENKENKGSAISQEVDLRKKALSKSLPGNFASASPRTRRAMDMYNNLRAKCEVLCTPQIDRTVKTSNSAANRLSKTIQKQCLLLQDTPKHVK